MIRTRFVAIAATATMTTALFASSAHPAGAATSWRATATKAETLVAATDLGRAAAATPLRIAVALNLRNRAALESGIGAGAVLTPAQFTAAYSPTAADAQAVASYLTSAGFTSVAVATNRLLVTASGTVAKASAAFNTPIESYQQHGRTVYANTAAAQVPASLTAVGAVLGLTNANLLTARPAVAASAPSSCVIAQVGYPCTYNPQGFWKAYNATSTPTGSATNIGIFTEGDMTGVVADLRTEETANGLAAVPVTVVHTGPASSDVSGADEWDMDTQYSSGMAGTVASLTLYTATSLTDTDLTAAFNRFAADGTVTAASASFGGCEFASSLDGSMLADDNAFEEAAAQGQTVFTSAGDTGGFCPVGVAANGVPAGVPDVNYPASSPWVVSVGGTTLITTSTGAYSQEIAWLAGGGGPSLFEAPAAFQTGVLPPVGTACGLVSIACGRAVPDVAMDADPNSGANVYVNGAPEGVGGTSLSSPLMLGVWARVESAGGNAVGFAGPKLYAASGTTAFHDIILGDTGPYPATPGYDFATGLGTVNVAAAIATID
jgi:pseudomonalisin/xanthomonalisin